MVWTDDYKNITLGSSLRKDERNHFTNSTVQLIAESTTKITCTIKFFAPNITSKISWTKSFEVVGVYHQITIESINIQLI